MSKIKKIFGGGSISLPSPPPLAPLPSPDDEAIKAKGDEAAKVASARRGLIGNVKTPPGLGSGPEPTTRRSALLGQS